MNSTGIDVVEYDDRWADAQTAFASRNWQGKARRGDPNYLRWQYRGPERGPVPGLLLAVDGSNVVGQVGMIPGTIDDGSGQRPIQWIGNLMVDPDRRRTGVSTAIFERALDRPVLTLGTDPSPSAAGMMATVGFARGDSSDLMVLPLDLGAVAAARYPQVARLQRPMSLIGAPVTRFLTRQLRAEQGSQSAQVCTWRDIVADVERAERTESRPRTVHDEAFLRWRGAGFPPFVREVDAVRTDSGSFAIVERADPRLLVLQWHGIDEAETKAIFGRVAFIAGSYKSKYVQAMATDVRQREILANLGFRARRTPTDLWWYPGDELTQSPTVAVQGYDTDQNL